MKALVVCTLLFVLPLAGVRMVCLNGDVRDPGAEVRTEGATATETAADEADDCSKFCLLPGDEGQATTTEVSCALVPDPTCAFVLTTAIAVIPTVLPAPAPAAFVTDVPVLSIAYDPPALPKQNPPPKPTAA